MTGQLTHRINLDCQRRMESDFKRHGKPTDNSFIKAFNGRFRQECLNENWFLSLEDVEEKVCKRRIDPPNSHYAWYRKWGKTSHPGS